MGKENWVVQRIDEDGCVLRRDIYVYVVPRDALPPDVETGDVLETSGAGTEGFENGLRVERKRAS